MKARPTRSSLPRRCARSGGKQHERVSRREHGSAHVRVPDRGDAHRLSGGLRPRRHRRLLWSPGCRARPAVAGAVPGAAAADVGGDVERHAARGALLHLHGADPERSGMAEDLLDTVGQLFGPLRGGLAFAVIFVGALLAATTGVVAASVISMGLISLPIMLRYGYDRRFASGVISASGTLAQIIPPS